MIRITSLLVVALAAHSHAAAQWQGCTAVYASADCSGAPMAGQGGCGPVNSGCEEDTNAGTWDKMVSDADVCADGVVVMESKGNADQAACDAANATDVAATIGNCKVIGIAGYGSQMFACTDISSAATASTTASAVVVLLAAVASHMF
jgi:hypothetical protein